jgi:hypothetical protein
MTDAVQDAVLGNVWELYTNAFEHGKSPVGVLSCGQYYPKIRTVRLAIGDFGIGIPDNVRMSKGPGIKAQLVLCVHVRIIRAAEIPSKFRAPGRFDWFPNAWIFGARENLPTSALQN